MRLLNVTKRCLVLCILWICVLLCLAFLWRNFMRNTSLNNGDRLYNGNITEVLWWNNLPSDYQSIRFCESTMCRFSAARKTLNEAKAVLFYGSDLHVEDLPLPRSSDKIWALVHEESPRNRPFMLHEIVLKHFNYTSTFSRYSHQPLTTQYLPSLQDLTSPAYLIPVGEKSTLRTRAKLAPIVFLQSDCDTLSGREQYVKELQRHIAIDSYGLCLHNRDLPKELASDYLNNLYAPTLLHFLARYKFIIAFENGVCYDYVTEKFWRPLLVGSIPIYFGSPTIKDWAPNPKSVIYINEFRNPAALADFLHKLDKNDTEYNSYLSHKFDQLRPIQNGLLLAELHRRDIGGFSGSEFFNNFECFICNQLHKIPAEHTQPVSLSHYHCPLPPIRPPMEDVAVEHSSDWDSIMQVGVCSAKVLDSLLNRNMNFSRHEFDQLLELEISSDKCELKNL